MGEKETFTEPTPVKPGGSRRRQLIQAFSAPSGRDSFAERVRQRTCRRSTVDCWTDQHRPSEDFGRGEYIRLQVLLWLSSNPTPGFSSLFSLFSLSLLRLRTRGPRLGQRIGLGYRMKNTQSQWSASLAFMEVNQLFYSPHDLHRGETIVCRPRAPPTSHGQPKKVSNGVGTMPNFSCISCSG